MAAGTRAAFSDYLKEFPAGVHAQEAQVRIAELTPAAAAPSHAFDGAWLTYEFLGQVKDGDYHGEKGAEDQRGWLVLDGKIEPHGSALMLAKGIVGASACAAGNASAGDGYVYHVKAQFAGAHGSGKRIEVRICNLTFVKQ